LKVKVSTTKALEKMYILWQTFDPVVTMAKDAFLLRFFANFNYGKPFKEKKRTPVINNGQKGTKNSF